MTGISYKPVMRCSTDQPLCVQVTRLGSDECPTGDEYKILDSNNTDGSRIVLTRRQLVKFVEAVAASTDSGGGVQLEKLGSNLYVLRQVKTGITVSFNQAEIDNFRLGCQDGEFSIESLSQVVPTAA